MWFFWLLAGVGLAWLARAGWCLFREEIEASRGRRQRDLEHQMRQQAWKVLEAAGLVDEHGRIIR